jgi:hypothetical protein
MFNAEDNIWYNILSFKSSISTPSDSLPIYTIIIAVSIFLTAIYLAVKKLRIETTKIFLFLFSYHFLFCNLSLASYYKSFNVFLYDEIITGFKIYSSLNSIFSIILLIIFVKTKKKAKKIFLVIMFMLSNFVIIYYIFIKKILIMYISGKYPLSFCLKDLMHLITNEYTSVFIIKAIGLFDFLLLFFIIISLIPFIIIKIIKKRNKMNDVVSRK